MKRIRNPDTGRFHTPEEAFEALASVGALFHCDLEKSHLYGDSGEDDFEEVSIVEVAIDQSALGWERAMNVFRAAIPHKDEEECMCYQVLRRPGFDFYVPYDNPKVAALEKLMAPLRALLA